MHFRIMNLTCVYIDNICFYMDSSVASYPRALVQKYNGTLHSVGCVLIQIESFLYVIYV